MEQNLLIEFSGKPSAENIEYLVRFDRKRSILLLIILVISMIVLAFSVSMLTIEQTAAMFAIYIIVTVISGIIVLYGLVVCLLLQEALSFKWPFYQACYFDNQKTIISEWKIENHAIYDPSIKSEIPPPNISVNNTAVRKVFEAENFYIIVAGWFYKKAFVCQKNLLTAGTLEGFEGIFEGKIVRAH